MSNLSNAPAAFKAHEKAAHLQPAYCYVVQIADGTTLFLTSRDRPVALSGLPAEFNADDPQQFTPGQINHGTVSATDSFSASSTTITVTSEQSALAQYFVTAGTVRLNVWILRLASENLHSAALEYSDHAVIVQSGIIGKFGMEGNTVAMELTPVPFYTEGQIPRFYYSRQCQHFLYGPQVAGVGCGLDKADFAWSTTIATLNRAQREIIVTGQAPAAAAGDYFSAGHFVHATLGPFMVAWSEFDGSDTKFKLATWHPELAGGDSITAYPGCRRTLSACRAFGNVVNFGGFPDVPNKSPLQGLR